MSSSDPVLSLPYEVVAEIFLCVPPDHIITVCRHVSKTWKSFVDDPLFWQFRLRKCRNFSPKLMEIPPDKIHWPKLYLSTAWGPNLIKSVDSSSGEFSLTPWRISYDSWEDFSHKKVTRKMLVAQPQPETPSWRGGNKWSIESQVIKPEDPHFEQILKENGNSSKNYVTSYIWCCRHQVIELSQCGFSDSVMDIVQPLISFSEWYAARWDCGSIFCIRVDLLDSKMQVVASYEDSVTTDQWQGGELGWRRVEGEFKNYGPGVRFVRFADGGKDTKWWDGHYGSKMAGARLIISFN